THDVQCPLNSQSEIAWIDSNILQLLAHEGGQEDKCIVVSVPKEHTHYAGGLVIRHVTEYRIAVDNVKPAIKHAIPCVVLQNAFWIVTLIVHVQSHKHKPRVFLRNVVGCPLNNFLLHVGADILL